MISILKASGLIIISAGIVLSFKPDLVSPPASKYTGYEMIESRVKWGVLIGLGIFLTFFQRWGQWGATTWAILATLTFGIIIARLIGFVRDGLFNKQILWLLIEVVIAMIFSLAYWKFTDQ
ncbi:MAG: DUF4345 family protein [Chitinophagaceae bacterium]|nr:DUF4345 family protein [Chitinophagaceae bacterium]